MPASHALDNKPAWRHDCQALLNTASPFGESLCTISGPPRSSASITSNSTTPRQPISRKHSISSHQHHIKRETTGKRSLILDTSGTNTQGTNTRCNLSQLIVNWSGLCFATRFALRERLSFGPSIPPYPSRPFLNPSQSPIVSQKSFQKSSRSFPRVKCRAIPLPRPPCPSGNTDPNPRSPLTLCDSDSQSTGDHNLTSTKENIKYGEKSAAAACAMSHNADLNRHQRQNESEIHNSKPQ